MPHKFILQRIRFSISTLSKYVRVKKLKKIKKRIFVPSGTSSRYKCTPATLEGEGGRDICIGPRLHSVQM
jgi:hypothetical protein